MQTNERYREILSSLHIDALNAMQQTAQHTIIKEKEILLLAPTGSGKTLAFLLPLVQLLNAEEDKVQCLVLAPSRELALQIEQVWKKMSTGFKVNCCYGGHSMPTEIQNLSTPPALLIGTPGRIADHIRRETFDCSKINILILDEFDKSLPLGFHEEMSFIISELKALKKRVLVSATDALEIPDFTGVVQPEVLDFITEREDEETLQLKMVISEEKDKIETLFRLLCYNGSASTIIFCNHREAAERTSSLLKEKGIENACFHGGLEQMEREQTLVQFRNGTVPFLVATDLAARGLDIPEVKHVIHYHLPATREEFTHRNGRTARMQAQGTAYIVAYEKEPLPPYISEKPEEIDLPANCPLPKGSSWTTLYISGGKKDKLNKIDIVGFLSQKGKLEKADLGLIEVKDFVSFAAVKKHKVKDLLRIVQHEKMKGKKYLIKVAR